MGQRRCRPSNAPCARREAARNRRRRDATSGSAATTTPAGSPWPRRSPHIRRTPPASTNRSTAWCFGVGCRYWPMVRKSILAARMSSITCSTSLRCFAQAHHHARLGEQRRVQLLGALEQPQRSEIARARAHGQILRRHGFEIVVEHVRLRRDDRLERPLLAQEIRRQDLDRRLRARRGGWRRWCARNAAPRRRRDRRGRPRSRRHAQGQAWRPRPRRARARLRRADRAGRCAHCRRRRRGCRCRP